MAMTFQTPRSPLALADLLSGNPVAEGSAPTALADEEAFLHILPKIDIPDDVLPIPGAVNEEFLNCAAFWPEGYKDAQSGPEARALRDIYSLVRARNIVATSDCRTTGKVANRDAVDAPAAVLRNHHGVDRLKWQKMAEIPSQARHIIEIAETTCGGSF